MATATDPICLMEVDTDGPNGGASQHDGRTYYFCGPGCKVAFDRDPEGWAGGRNQPIAMDDAQPQPLSILRRMFRRNR